jgi:HSP20 family protein
MAITRWDPFNEVARIQNTIDRMFGDSLARPFRYVSAEGAHVLPLDVYETPTELVVRAQVPGVTRDQVTVTAERGTLTIQAHVPSDAEAPEAKEYRWHYREIWHGDVARSIALPPTVDPEKAGATFTDGVLTLRIPKVEAAKPRQIPISVN